MTPVKTHTRSLTSKEQACFDIQINEVIELFQKAEQVLKLSERSTLESNIPAINELRYAGCHLTKALSTNTSYDEKISDLAKAKSHCKRSFYDTIEGTILYLLEDIRQFNYDYRNVAISDLIKDYATKLKEIEDIKKTTKRIATDKEKEALYESLHARISYLQSISEEFNLMRQEINKRMNSNRTTRLVTIAGASGGVATFLMLTYKAVKYFFF